MVKTSSKTKVFVTVLITMGLKIQSTYEILDGNGY